MTAKTNRTRNWFGEGRNFRTRTQGTRSEVREWETEALLRGRSDSHHESVPQARFHQSVSRLPLLPLFVLPSPLRVELGQSGTDDNVDAFKSSLREEMTPLNLDRLQHWIDRGLLDPKKPITMKELYETRCVHGIKYGVKLLASVSICLFLPGSWITPLGREEN